MTILVLLVVLGLSTGSALANFTNGPKNPGGGIVTRGGDIILLSTEDFKADLTAIHNGDIITFCLEEDEPFVYMNFQHVDVPEDTNRIKEIIHGDDIPTTVWPFAVDWDQDLDDICEMFLNSEPLASGTAKFRSTDNDLFVFENPDNKNANAWGYTSQGKLTGPCGERLHFNSVFRMVWDGVDGESVINITSKINLK
jgi:hypothetical protein